MPARASLLPLLAACLAAAGCRDAQVTVYTIPKEKDPAIARAPASDMTGGPTAPPLPGPGLVWTPAAHWHVHEAGATRRASYGVGEEGGAEAELAVTVFPGDVGGELANVNRWRGQVQLPPLAAADLEGAITRLEHNGLRFAVVDFAGGGQRVLGAIVPVEANTWFFKLAGPDALVAREKAAFLAYLATVKKMTP